MAFLFQKFQEVVKTLAKNPAFAKDPRHLQFEADINRLFLYTSYSRLGRDADEADAEEIIDMANKASLADQQKQVQDNIHSQIEAFCESMDDILRPGPKGKDEPLYSSSQRNAAPGRSGLSLAIGRGSQPNHKTYAAIPNTEPLRRAELSQKLKAKIGYTLQVKPSQIQHEEAGQGLFIDGQANVGAVIAFYPGIVYSPAYYRYIPGYPRVDANNPYLINRYDGTVINAQPWGTGGESLEIWDWSIIPASSSNDHGDEKGSDRMWKMLSRPLEATRLGVGNDVLERRNPLAFAHFANHPAKDMTPNVMLCPFDFPLTEKEMRAYIPNIVFGGREEVKMKKFGTFWFKSWGSGGNGGSDVPVLRSLVLVATRALSDEEVLLNYRLSNSKRRPSWYTPVDEEEDRRRWS